MLLLLFSLVCLFVCVLIYILTDLLDSVSLYQNIVLRQINGYALAVLGYVNGCIPLIFLSERSVQQVMERVLSFISLVDHKKRIHILTIPNL